MKIAFIDIETTGLSPQAHEIIDLAVVVFDSESLEIEDKFQSRVRPQWLKTATPKALEVNGYNEKDWEDAETKDRALAKFCAITQGCVLMGHNVAFDWGFLEAALSRTGYQNTFWYQKLDLVSIAHAKFPEIDITTKCFSLKNLCEKFNIEPEPPIHTAMNGAMKGYECYKRLMQMI